MTSITPGRPEAQYPVIVDKAPYANDDAATRLRKKEDAVRQIMERTPAASHEGMRRMLRDIEEPSMLLVMEVSDPELARLLGIVQSIHHASKKVALTPEQQQKHEFIRLEIALVSGLLPPGVIARVIRRTGDFGWTLVLLPEAQASASDIGMAEHLAESEYRMRGRFPVEETSTDYRERPAGVEEPKTLRRLEADFARLQAQPPKDIPGVGPAKVLTVGVTVKPT